MSSGEVVVLAPAGYDVDPDHGSDPERPWRLVNGLSRRGLAVTVVARRVARQSELGPGVTLRLLPGRMPATPIGRLLDRLALYLYARRVALSELRVRRVLALHHVAPCGPTSPSLLPRLGVPFVYGPMPNLNAVVGASQEGWPLWLGFKKASAYQRVVGNVLTLSMTPGARFLMRRTLRMADAVTVEAAANRPRQRPDATVIPMGLDVGFFSPADAPPVPGRILAVGPLLPRKGIDVVIEALAKVKREIPSLHAIIAGGGPGLEPLQQLAARLGVGSSVTFLGRIPRQELPELYRSAMVFCHAARSDTYPTVVLEAMACGLPVLSSDFGPLPEMIGSAGLIHPVGSADLLSEDLRVILTDEPRRRELSTVARDRAVGLYSDDRMCESYLSLYTELASRNGRRRPPES